MSRSPFLINLDLSKLKGKKKVDRKQKKKPRTKNTFPLKLHNMLTEAETRGNESIVSWQPDGRSFMVHDTKQLVTKVMPSYFKQTKYKSFQRQLNLYGFHRVESGYLEGSYYHPSFIRGSVDMCRNIVRQKRRNHTAQPKRDSNITITSISSGSSKYDSDDDESIKDDSFHIGNADKISEAVGDKAFDDTCSYDDDEFATFQGMRFCLLNSNDNDRIDAKKASLSKEESNCSEKSISFAGKHFHLLESFKADFI